MITQSMIGMVRYRWKSERTFKGHTNESLHRKIKSPATREAVREQARRKLQFRGQIFD